MEATSIAAISAYAKSAAPLPDGDNRPGAIEVSATVANGRVKKNRNDLWGSFRSRGSVQLAFIHQLQLPSCEQH